MHVPILQEGVPRERGARECGDYEPPPAARCSSEPHPWRIFGYFLCEQKVTFPLRKNNAPG